MRGRFVLYAYLVAVLAYISLTFLLPPDANTMARFNLSTSEVRLLDLAVSVPLMLIWGAAFYGYAKLRRYSDTIKSSGEGMAVRWITHGIMVLVVGMPAANIINRFLRYLGHSHEGWTSGLTVTTNYISLLFPLAAFLLISIGARSLAARGTKRTSPYGIHMMLLLFGLIAVGYTSFVVYFAFDNNPSAVASIYYMPLWLVLTTLVVPYVYTWFIGLMAAYELMVYNASLKGVLYRKSWSRVSIGLGLVLLSQIVVQYLTTLTRQLSDLKVAAIIGVVYGLFFLMAAGYIILALGLKKLQKIEEV